jgi:uncharacterized YigZ family protein
MAAELFTLAGPARYVEEIRKSRFLTLAAPVASPEAALAFFASVSDPTATHNCWAYRIGQTYRFNDDGEPGGTAGRPMLQAIDGQQCDRVAVLCIRWYGGINLGTGGLARAYGGGAAQCLRLAERLPIIDTVAASFHCSFSEWPVLRARVAALDAAFRDPVFQSDGVDVIVDIPRIRVDELRTVVSDISRGRAEVAIEA